MRGPHGGTHLLHLLLHLELLLALLLFDLLLDYRLFLLFDLSRLGVEVVLPIVVVTRMVLLHLIGLEVVVPDITLWVSAGFPRTRERRLQTLFSDVEKMLILFKVHAEVPRIVFDVFQARLKVLIQLFFQELVPLGNQCII